MRIEEHFREILSRAVADEPPVADAWERFERRARRGRRVRLVAAAALSGAVAAAIVFSPRLLASRPPRVVTPAAPGGLTAVYVDPVAGFRLRYPAEWERRERGDTVWFLPPGAPPGEVVETTADQSGLRIEKPRSFFVEVRRSKDEGCPQPVQAPGEPPIIVDCGPPASGSVSASASVAEQNSLIGVRGGGADVTAGPTVVGGREALRSDISFPERPRSAEEAMIWCMGDCAPDYWCPKCRMTRFAINWYEPWGLYVRVVAPDGASVAEFGAIGLRIVESIERFLPTPPSPD